MRFLPGVAIPPAVHLTTDIAEALAGTGIIWVAAIPTVCLRPTLQKIAPTLGGDRPVLSLVKGIENETFLRFRNPGQILGYGGWLY